MFPAAASKLSTQFLIGTFLPAAVFVSAVDLTIRLFPMTENENGQAIDWTALVGALFVGALVLAALLDMLNFFVVRFFEGFVLPSRVAEWGRRRHAAALKRMTDRIEHLKQHPGTHDEAYELERRRYLMYPIVDVLPTRLGNSIAAWEQYPYRRYQIDAVTTWPRLSPLLPAQVTGAISSAKAVFDFVANSIVLLVVWGVLKGTLLAHSETAAVRAAWLCGSTAVAVCVWATALVPAAMSWGETVKAAFDLHRLDLLRQMGVLRQPAMSAAEEKKMWREVIWAMKYDYESRVRYAMRPDDAKANPEGGVESEATSEESQPD